ncbi:DoxX family membrane protein [Opitutales bacterium ASA1]|uniref:MauE/DoxX family redox-associated membrane protein n=1 Tax=Congregicoccus parvus TaxID=3081749 RepID=UPI002B2C221F|nr:DoxX family membrane protein [Opitutales bacterium ASA1]
MTRWITLVVRCIVGGLFVYAGWVKARAPDVFVRDIWNYRLIPEDFVFWIAAALPYLEVVAGVALITGFQRRGAHVLIASMLLTFVAALASAWMRGLDIACGCFGSAGTDASDYPLLIGRNLLMLAGIVYSARRMRADSAQQASRPA